MSLPNSSSLAAAASYWRKFPKTTSSNVTRYNKTLERMYVVHDRIHGYAV